MSLTINVGEAQANLRDLIHQLTPGDEIIITENQQPVAMLVSKVVSPPRNPRVAGLGKGSIIFMAPDFDAPLDDFKEYME